MEQRNSLVTILGILLAIVAIAAIFFAVKHSNKVKQAKIDQMQIDSLVNVRTQLETELNSLNLQYSAISLENDSLKGSLESAREAIALKDEQLRWARRKAAKDIKAIQEEISVLRVNRDAMTATIDRLTEENKQLKTSNSELTEKLTASEAQNTQLVGQVGELEQANKLLEERSAILANTSFKATAMQVDMASKGEKTTFRAGKVRKIKVGFDLIDIPYEYQGEQNLYLVITDANGKPIEQGGQKVKVGADAQAIVIEPVETKLVNIGESQRLEFTHELMEKPRKGYIIVSIYADKGLIGSTIYQLV